jgi:hypothetical protein
LQNNCFEEQHFLGAAFGGSFTDNFGEQLSVATLWRSFLEPLCGIALGGAAQLWGAALVSSLGQLSGPALRQLRGAALEFWRVSLGRGFGNNFEEQFCGFAAILTNSCFEERQLWTIAFESNFGK